MSERANVLKMILEQDPKNTFARYGLAMELAKTEAFEAAMAEFSTILENDASYGAAYFHGGQTLEKMGLTAEAAALYRRGMEATTRSGDGHTFSELQAALGALG